MIYNEKDIPDFQKEYCEAICHLKGQCIKENKDNHWFLTCPFYHKWKLGYEYVVKV